MNHYPRHIGDWIKATAHLSEVEECIYSRCLDVYYDREEPLPADTKQVCRLVRAATGAAKKAVNTVLNEFFHLEGDGWHNKRADEEIAKCREKSEKARESAGQRWGKTNSGNNANAYANASKTHTGGNASQEPRANSQEPMGVIHSAGNSATVGAQAFSPGDLTKPMVQAGIRCNPGHPDIIALAKAGCAPANVQAAIDEAKRAKGEGASITQGYVVAILKRWQSEPARTLPKSQSPPGTVSSFGKAGQETAASAQRWLEKSGETG